MLKRIIKDWVKEIIAADDQTFVFGNTSLSFSPPVPHGEVNTPLGWVLMLTVEPGDVRFVHASDVQGSISNETLKIIIKQHPNFLYVGGPPLYLLNYRISSSVLKHGLKNIKKLAENISTVILDHHLLRAEDWKEFSKLAFEAAYKMGNKIVTAAGFLGETDNALESRRKTLYHDEPPSQDVNRWLALPREKRRYEKPF